MSFNKILASFAAALAVLAALVGVPQKNELSYDEIASLIEQEKDHITPDDLAERILSGEKIRLIDLRDSTSFTRMHISASENMSISQIVNGGIKRNETVVLYSSGGIHASQAWVLLKMNRFDSVYTLLGGFTGWKEQILFPVLNEDASEQEQKNFERRQKISLSFGGTPTILRREPVRKKPAREKQLPPHHFPPVLFQKEEDKLREGC